MWIHIPFWLYILYCRPFTVWSFTINQWPLPACWDIFIVHLTSGIDGYSRRLSHTLLWWWISGIAHINPFTYSDHKCIMCSSVLFGYTTLVEWILHRIAWQFVLYIRYWECNNFQSHNISPEYPHEIIMLVRAWSCRWLSEGTCICDANILKILHCGPN